MPNIDEAVEVAVSNMDKVSTAIADSTGKVVDTVTNTVPTVTGSLIDVAKDAMDIGVKGGTALFDYLKGEVPELITQLLLWKGFEAGFNILVALVPFVLTYYIGKFLYKKADYVKKLEEEIDECDKGAVWVAYAIVWVVYITFALCNLSDSLTALKVPTLDLIKIVVAPKIYILEYLAQYI